MTDAASPIRVAIIGSGPAGFYAAGHLLAEGPQTIEVDMLERLPTPWGLVRSGVAPDHPKIKSVTRIYERTAEHDRFRFFGNIEVGVDVSRAELARHYHALVYATGSLADRPLGIPGEELPGSLPATELVAWYNAHPDHHALAPDLSCKRAIVIGNGNVALDVARMLVLPISELARTDIADHALAALEQSAIEEVLVAGRRGPAQAAFTNPELRELAEIEGVEVEVDGQELEDALAVEDPHADPTAKRNVETLREYAQATAARRRKRAAGDEGAAAPRRIVLRFLLSPLAIEGGERGVQAVTFVRNRLEADAAGRLRAVGTGQRERIEAGLVARAVGYRGSPLPDVPFDAERYVIPNERGRVIDPAGGGTRRGEYVVGWIKRGPTGVIGTNKKDAHETVSAILEDLRADRLPGPEQPSPDQALALLRARQPNLVTYAGWRAIDHHERARGAAQGRPRTKLARIEELLEVAAKAGSEEEISAALQRA
ncbi:MAG TPA: FAD-dependent oxidoreductase [Solirubrobacteraceae bacterium]|nr:FAD-dependent oxidoreductase [Solirubrobacteraceae bacterium]